MNALQWIVKEAKSLKKKFPKRYSTWKEYVAQASAIYASKHKGKSPVGKKHKVAGTKKHTDTKSHNVNIKVESVKKIKFSKASLDKTQQYYKYKGIVYEIHEDQDGKPYIRVDGKVIYFTGVPRIGGYTGTHRKGGHTVVSYENNSRRISGYTGTNRRGKETYVHYSNQYKTYPDVHIPKKIGAIENFKYKTQPEIVVGKIGDAKTLENLIPTVKVRVTRGRQFNKKPIIEDIKTAAEIFRKYIAGSKLTTQEHFAVMYLNRQNRVLGVYMHTVGGIVSVTLDTRLVLAAALNLGAVGLILCHNHPSGNLTPSQADIDVTKDVIKAARYHQISVVDHIILTPESYTSLAARGYVKF